MSTFKKQLHVNLFEMACVGHIIHGQWVHPDNNRHRFNEIGYWKELAQLLEHGTFDGVFLADVVGAYDHNDTLADALIDSLQIPNIDPLLVIPAMAAVTKNLGFGATFSTTYEPPFAFARRASTLDHLTDGRFGWNIVTSYLKNAALNFGREDEVPHDDRYNLADEYLDVLYKLWEGSWDDDAVIQDRERRIYTNPSKVRYIDHVSPNFKVKGPHLAQPSRQRTPVLYQATGSPAGKEFAGRHAELVFTGGGTTEAARQNIADIQAAAVRHGRDASSVKFIVQAGVIVGRNDVEVANKVDTYRRLSYEASRLHPGRLGVDLTRFAPETLIADIIERKEAGWERLAKVGRFARTMGDLIQQQQGGRLREGRFFVAGTPSVVADEIEKWLDIDGLDGINLRQYLSFETARDFIDLVVPELRRRGRFRESYHEGETLRERIFGPGHARLPANHFGARYRDPANLQVPRPPLVFPEPTPEELANGGRGRGRRFAAAQAASAATASSKTAAAEPVAASSTISS